MKTATTNVVALRPAPDQRKLASQIDTIETLRVLLAQAEAGQCIGIAYAAMYRNNRYITDAAGEACRNPTFSRGMVRALDDELGRRARGE